MKIAPTLAKVVKRDYSGPYLFFVGDQEEHPQVQRELRALVAVAKYARIWAATDPWPSSTDARLNALHRAIQRLDQVSRPSPGTRPDRS